MEQILNKSVEAYTKAVNALWRWPVTRIPFAVLIAPWCVVCWIGAGAVYFVSGIAKRDTSGDIGLAVVAAPFFVPIMPLTIAVGVLRKRRERKKNGRLAEAASWIAAELVAGGIYVRSAMELYGRVSIDAPDVPADQTASFRRVYASAVRRFADLSVVELCAEAKPLHLLDAAWARQHGVSAYAEEKFTGPCEDCGDRRSLGHFIIGDRIVETVSSTLEAPRCVTFEDGTTRHLDGYLCDACLNRKPWKSMGACYGHHHY